MQQHAAEAVVFVWIALHIQMIQHKI
jgi:hypothetical protein